MGLNKRAGSADVIKTPHDNVDLYKPTQDIISSVLIQNKPHELGIMRIYTFSYKLTDRIKMPFV